MKLLPEKYHFKSYSLVLFIFPLVDIQNIDHLDVLYIWYAITGYV